MITPLGKHYLYRHIRLDTNEPFYIGIGTKIRKRNNTIKGDYQRAFSKSKRNAFWWNVVNKAAYEIEILLESDDYDFIQQKEIEFIALYQRKDCCNGILVNLTDGGGGNLGHIATSVHRKNISEALKVVYSFEDYIFSNSKEVIDTDTGVIYPSMNHTARVLGIPASSLSQMLNNKTKNTTYLCYLKNYKGVKIEPNDYKYKLKIINKITKEVYDSLKALKRAKGFDTDTMSKKLKGLFENNTDFIYLWEYDKNIIDENRE